MVHLLQNGFYVWVYVVLVVILGKPGMGDEPEPVVEPVVVVDMKIFVSCSTSTPLCIPVFVSVRCIATGRRRHHEIRTLHNFQRAHHADAQDQAKRSDREIRQGDRCFVRFQTLITCSVPFRSSSVESSG